MLVISHVKTKHLFDGTDKTSHLGQNFFKGFAKSFKGFGDEHVFIRKDCICGEM